MSIKYFDDQDNLVEQSSKNSLRPFKVSEAYAILYDNTRVNNPDFDQQKAKAEKNKEQRKKRQERFAKESDVLLLEIQAMKILGQNTTAKEQEFTNAYNKIKTDLPMVQ